MSMQAATAGGSLGANVPAPAPTANRDAHTLVGTGIGNALEWFDWSIYSTFAAFFAGHFFGKDPISAFIAATGVFAVGFIARPAGAFLFGAIADRVGRKHSLMLTVAAGALGSFIIGVSPGYATVGVLAPIILILARIIQGLAHGGEQPAAQSYIAEAAPAERRGLWASLIYFSGTIGATLGVALGALLSGWLGKEAMFDYGWRIPFIIGGIGGLFALFMRLRMAETEQFTQLEEQVSETSAKPRLMREIGKHWRSAAQVVGITVGLTVAYYYWVVAASGFSIAVLKADPTKVLLAQVAANVIFLVWLPLWGILSDRIGRKPVMFIGIAGLVVGTVPLSKYIDGNPVHLFWVMTVMLFFIAAVTAISPAIMTEIFPTRIRTIGVALPLSIAIAIFGGTSLTLQTWMATNPWVKSTFGANAFPIYVTLLLLVTAAAMWTVPETKGRILDDDDAKYLG